MWPRQAKYLLVFVARFSERVAWALRPRLLLLRASPGSPPGNVALSGRLSLEWNHRASTRGGEVLEAYCVREPRGLLNTGRRYLSHFVELFAASNIKRALVLHRPWLWFEPLSLREAEHLLGPGVVGGAVNSEEFFVHD